MEPPAAPVLAAPSSPSLWPRATALRLGRNSQGGWEGKPNMNIYELYFSEGLKPPTSLRYAYTSYTNGILMVY